MDAEVAVEVRNLVEAAVAAVRSSQESSMVMEQLDEIEALLAGLQPGWGMGSSGGGGGEYVCGADSNIKFTDVTEGNYSTAVRNGTSADVGKIAVDVYYV